ncbi:MAG: polysaccharide biosynthesis tyrosine autokinase [Mariniblastus sp.]|nr:polysaccharide biosynthesis tyrosine autokinase [Mariniblastus sp.]
METPNHPMPPQMASPILLADPNQVDEDVVFDFWGVLNRRKWLIFLGLFTGVSLGYLYDVQTEKIYQSKAVIRIEPKNPMALPISRSDLMLPETDNFARRHDRIINQEITVHNCLENNNLFVLDSLADLPEDEAVAEVLENLEIEPEREDPYNFQLSFRSTDGDDTQTILNNLIETYRNELEDEYNDKSDQFVTLLKDVKHQFDTSYKRVVEQIRLMRNQITSPVVAENGRNIHQVRIHDLSGRIDLLKIELNNYLASKDRILEALENGEEAMKEQIWILAQNKDLSLNSGSEQMLRSEYELSQKTAQAEIALNAAKMRLGTSHPTVKSLAAQAVMWRQFARDSALSSSSINNEPDDVILKRYLMAVDQSIFDAKSNLDEATKEFNFHVGEEEKLSKVREAIDDLTRERDYIEGLLTTARNKIVEIDASEDLNGGNKQEGFTFRSLQIASYGDVVWPILPVSLGIGGMMGLLFGFGLGCLVDLADKTFHNPDEIVKQLNLPLIGHVPVISQSKRFLVENSAVDPIICSYHRPKSQTAEAFRAVRTALYFNTQGKEHSVIQVTSPTPGDGKTTLAANLAVSIAQSGKRCLLVDADMRRPRQASTFGIQSAEGFSTILSGQSHWRDVVFECQEVGGLSILPSGAKPNNPAELSTLPAVKDLIEELREEYDFVIIDTPPLLAVTDPCPIAARVDGVILTLRIKKNVRISAERASEILRNLGANIIGLVVNGVGAQSGYGSQYTYGAYRAGYAYNGYGYGYGYGYGSKYYDEQKTGNREPVRNIEAAPTNENQQPPVA